MVSSGTVQSEDTSSGVDAHGDALFFTSLNASRRHFDLKLLGEHGRNINF